jgi:hypothetical protein
MILDKIIQGAVGQEIILSKTILSGIDQQEMEF